ncbi:MAG: ABC transporter permease [Dehalococcoidia bacterium]|nr:MAG: ABC transporter permease [Dehalococcoidia bacterium]
MKVLIRQTALEMRLFLRRRDDLFWTLAFPAFFIVLFGLIYGDTQWGPIRAIDYLLPGIIVMAVMISGIMNAATTFAEEREKGVYRRLSVTPLRKHIILGAQIISRYVIILVQTLLLLLIGILAFNISIVGNYAVFWLILTFGGLCFLAIGFSLTGLMRTAKSATPIAMIVFFFLMFLGRILFPVDVLPKALEYISNVLPATYLNDALRLIVIEGRSIGDVWLELAAIGGWMVVCLILAIRFFRWE